VILLGPEWFDTIGLLSGVEDEVGIRSIINDGYGSGDGSDGHISALEPKERR